MEHTAESAAKLYKSICEQAEIGKFVELDDAAYFLASSWINSPEIIRRILVERAIIREAVKQILEMRGESGPSFTISVHDGEEYALRKSRDLDAIMLEIGSTDSDYLVVHTVDAKKYFGELLLIYGNDGWDVIADGTQALDSLITRANQLADALGEFTSNCERSL